MATLSGLPAEVLLLVFQWVEPRDLASIRLCCREFNALVSRNPVLHREVYLNTWDTPREELDNVGRNWQDNLQKFAKMIAILRSKSLDAKTREFTFMSETLSDFLCVAHRASDGVSRNAELLAAAFDDKLNRSAFLYHSETFERARSCENGERKLRSSSHLSTSSSSAHMHVLHGAPQSQEFEDIGVDAYPFAASKIYDLRNYRQANLWGPFKNSGSGDVDWEKMEAIMIIIGNNLERRKVFPHGANYLLWNERFRSAFPHSCPLKSMPEEFDFLREHRKLDKRPPLPTRDDPYGINGLWMRIVCFVDYTELFAYNFHDITPEGQPLGPLRTEEATMVILMEMEAVEVEAPSPDDGQDLPVVHFRGAAKMLNDHWNPNIRSYMRGSVRMTKAGEIRWTTFSVYEGEERWRTEAIQVGGLRSGRGVLGTWFDANYDPHGPAGPTAFWKVAEGPEVPAAEETGLGPNEVKQGSTAGRRL